MHYYLPLEKVCSSILFTQRCFVLSLVEIRTVVMEKNIKMWKVYRQMDGQTDDGQHMIRKDKSFQLQLAKNMNTNITWLESAVIS